MVMESNGYWGKKIKKLMCRGENEKEGRKNENITKKLSICTIYIPALLFTVCMFFLIKKNAKAANYQQIIELQMSSTFIRF